MDYVCNYFILIKIKQETKGLGGTGEIINAILATRNLRTSYLPCTTFMFSCLLRQSQFTVINKSFFRSALFFFPLFLSPFSYESLK